MSVTADSPPNLPAADAVIAPEGGLGGYAREWWQGLKNGELGAVPIVVGIVIIAIIFQSQNANFLTAGNFVNLIAQMAAITLIGMGIVFVLLLGEIDLSVGFLSGIAGVVAAKLLLPGHWATAPGIIAALAVCVFIGVAIHGVFIAYLGVPSFVVTLAGLLAWNGLVLQVIGSSGTIVIQNKVIYGLANDYVDKAVMWIIVAASVAAYVGVQAMTVASRRKSGLPNQPWSLIGLRTALIAAVLIGAVAWANSDRGVPYVGLLMGFFLLLWTFVSTRTKFGRYVYAVGGNAEAARRAGINVKTIKVVVFGISGLMAGVGGLVLASRLSSVDTNTGGGSILLYSIAAAVIGGTSLFGGRGHIRSALLGATVIAMIDNGLGLVNVSAGWKFMITGGVLLLAATLDSLSRSKAAASGRA